METAPTNSTDANVQVERILDGMQAARDWRELRYMNGRLCAAHQRNSLLRYMGPGIRRVKREKDVEEE